jgi:fibronectin-binding autotransporter adhesin
MKINILKVICLLGILLAFNFTRAQAQTTAVWTGPATGGEWNTAADWSTLLPPAPSTNAWIGAGTNVSYNLPMAAANFGILTNNGTLNVNTNGFNCAGIYMVLPAGGERLYMSNGAAISTGAFINSSNTVAVLTSGASLAVNGALILSAYESSHASGTCVLTNSGGMLSALSTTVNNNTGTGNGLLVISGGTNYLGTTGVGRSSAGSGGFNALGSEGLIIYNGVVVLTNLNVGNASAASFTTTLIAGGVVTNNDSVFINQATSGRASRLLQTGGLFVVPDPGVVNPDPTVSGSLNNYAVTGGTNMVGGFYFGNTNGSAGTVNFTNAAAIYVGSQGIEDNGAVTLNAALNNGGLFGATTNWVAGAPMSLESGNFTFQAADPNGNPWAISLAGALGGTGSLTKTGGGTLSLGAANTYSGNTLISAGTLALGAGGSIASSTVYVGSGATFDVSALGGSFTLDNQTLGGWGVVNGGAMMATGSKINPGSNALTGVLTFDGPVTETGGVNNSFFLSSTPAGPNNDLMNIEGDLSVSGLNTVTVSGSLPNGAVYKLITYTGTFSGTVANFSLVGAVGVLTNDPTAKSISLITLATVRGPTNIVWLGNALNTNWDTSISTNWLVNGAPEYFIPNDSVTFNNLGASNQPVNIVGTVTPAAVTMNSSSNYVLAGSGIIGGNASLTLSNTDTGTLTILTTNNFSGATVIDGGELSVAYLAVGLQPSAIGASSSDPGNLIISNGTFNYFGASASIDRGATLGGTATFDVAASSQLVLGGVLQGSGGLTLVDAGTLQISGANTYSGVTTLLNGDLQISTVASALGVNTVNFAGGTLDLSRVGSQPTFSSAFTVVSNSFVISGNNDISSGNWTGTANVTLNVSIPGSGNTFTIDGSLTNFAGTVEMGDGAGTFRFNSGGGNTTFGGPNTTFDLGTNTVIMQARNAGTMAIGTLEGGNGTFLLGQGSDNGMVIWSIGANTNNPNSIFWGSVNNGAAANRACGITKVGNGSLTLGGVNNYSGATLIESGVLALVYNSTNGSDASINDSTNIAISAQAIFDVSGTSQGTFFANSSQTISGYGLLRGILDTTQGGTVSGGGGIYGSVGTLTVTNDINLGGMAWMKLNRAATPNSDRLVSTTAGTIYYGGTLVVTNIGAPLQVGDTFTLFSAPSLQNSFGTIILPDYYTWDTSNLAVNGTVSVTGVAAAPVFGGVDFSQLANGLITLNASNGAPNGPYTVLSTTNLALPLSDWTTVSTGNFDGNGNLSTQITVSPSAPQEFYELLAE